MPYVKSQITKDRKLNNLHKFVGWAGEPVLSGRAGRPSHKSHQIVSYLILIPKLYQFRCQVIMLK